MITVSIAINGRVIFARSAVNQGLRENGLTLYAQDDGHTLMHRREDGAVALAMQMLGKIHEQGVRPRQCTPR